MAKKQKSPVISKQEQATLKFKSQIEEKEKEITREITRASTSTTRGHFGCIFKATADCAT
jgi:hypothetical protein